MSNHLYNPLDEFESYSIHYLLLACRTTEVAEKFARDDSDGTNQRATLESIDAARFLGDSIAYGGSTDDIFLVIDTRRFGQFTVQELRYDVYVNGLLAGQPASTLATDLSMTVLDSVGVSFANFMQWLMDKQLQTNFDGIVFMLRTIFVGYRPDGSTEPVHSETIPMHLNRMDVNLDFAKGIYTLEFMPNLNFRTQQHARFLSIATATSIKSEDNTLGAAIASLNKTLNDRSTAFYEMAQSAVSPGASGATRKIGRKLTYQITIPSHWKPWTLSGIASSKAVETQFLLKEKIEAERAAAAKADGAKIQSSNISVPPDILIPEALELIFKQVQDIARMGNFQRRDDTLPENSTKSLKLFKFFVGLTSNNDEMTVHVDVVEFEVPNVLLHKSADTTPGTTNTSKADPTRREIVDMQTKQKVSVISDFIEYDYIFTGQNKDILNFDLKIQDFQFLLASNLRMGDGALRDATRSTPEEREYEQLFYNRPYDPIVPPIRTTLEAENFKAVANAIETAEKQRESISEAQRYSANISKFYTASPITVAMTIRGNPLLFHKFNVGVPLTHDHNEETYRADLQKRIMRQGFAQEGDGRFKMTANTPLSEHGYATAPVFVRVNIKGPSVDFKTNTELAGEYAQSSLTDVYYTLFRITNIFEGATNFKQELELYAHSIFNMSKIDPKDQTK